MPKRSLIRRAGLWLADAVRLLERPRPVEPEADASFPALRREAPIQIAPDFKTVDECKSAITALDIGQFQLAAWMIEQMLWNSRVRAVLGTRMDGLIGTEIRWEPGRQNALGRRAARDIVEDWPMMAAPATRKQLSRWGLLLGVGLGQKHWYVSPSSGRAIPRVETYHPQWVMWDWSLRAYRVWTLDGWVTVPSPSLTVPGEQWKPPLGATGQADSLRGWVVHEPFGQHSWREAMVHAGWRPWMGHEWSNRDQSRASEKLGLGALKLKYPKTTDKGALTLLMSSLRRLGSEGIIPVEQYGPAEQGRPSYDVEPFEWTGTGYDIIRGTKESNASDLAVLFLGHNTTAETKGASVGASAQIGNLIRGDIRVGDTYNEWATFYGQVVSDWAEVNYGDPGLAPVPIYVTNPPSENQAAATTLFNVATASQILASRFTGIDVTELLNKFRIPMLPGGVKVIPLSEAPPPQPLPPDEEDGQAGALKEAA